MVGTALIHITLFKCVVMQFFELIHIHLYVYQTMLTIAVKPLLL
jgi:hypothetical protein